MAPSTLTRTALGLATLAAGTSAYSRLNRQSARLTDTPQTVSSRASPDPTTSALTTDVLVVGSGGAALTAALRARTLGLDVLVVEKNPKLGGTSCYSGSGCWIPNTHVHAGHAEDSVDTALTYLESIVGPDAGPASSRERKLAFLTRGPEMVRWLADAGYRWARTPVYPDYFPYNPGARIGGRSIEADLFDASLLGAEWRALLNINPVRPPLPLYTYELAKIVRAKVSVDGAWTAAKIWGWRLWPGKYLLGGEPVTLGVSMISQLIYLNVRQGTHIWTASGMKSLTFEDDDAATGTRRVTGAVVEHDGRDIRVTARRGVILAAGGFARNDAMRKQYQQAPIGADWTSACATDQGDAISAAMAAGAATALMDSAWWGVALFDPKLKLGIWSVYDRGLPHSIIVDRKGRRYLNESQNYNSLGTKVWERYRESPDVIPSYLIMDSTHRKRYLLAGRFMPGAEIPASDLESGFIVKADTIPELARKLDIDADGLSAEVSRFNAFVDSGVDADFQRGSSIYDRYLGDPAYRKNPNLGKIEKGPFYASRMWPGDLGTKGGVLTDERARALKEGRGGKLEVIEGLYAVGNSSASVMGRTYAGAGSTLGPGLTFGYIAATECAEKKRGDTKAVAST